MPFEIIIMTLGSVFSGKGVIPVASCRRKQSEPGRVTLSENRHTSTMTIDKEYTSDLFLGFFFSTLVTSV